MIRNALLRVGLIAFTAAALRLVTHGEARQWTQLLLSVPGSIKSVLRGVLLRASQMLQ